MTSGIWIIIPSQAFDRGKTRLAPLLGAEERRQFCRSSLVHVVRRARAVVGAGNVLVSSRAAEVLGLARRLGVRAFRDSGRGLNRAVAEATSFAARHGAAGTLVVHGDLPCLKVQELARLVMLLARHVGVVLAPDELREGSNALGVLPAGRIRYCFGPDSFFRHCAQARQARLHLSVVSAPGLAQDVDTPENYRQFLMRKP